MAQILQFTGIHVEQPITALLDSIYDVVLAISENDHKMAEYVVKRLSIILHKMENAAKSRELVSDNVLTLISVLRDNHNIMLFEMIWMLVCMYQHNIDYVVPEIRADLS